MWMFLYVQHRGDILPVQNYITAICGFLVVEMIIIWGYYDFVNNHGNTVGSRVYLAILSVLNAFRNAFTFFLLLIVCLGYGVVRPSLGDLMWKCRALALAHFFFAVLYTVSSYIITSNDAGIVMMLVVLPLSLTMTTFYVWILSALTHTTKYLEERKQDVKARMYKNLWLLLLVSIIVIFAFFFINAVIITGMSDKEFITTHWKSRWFLLDGWLNVVYFVNFCAIAFLWRPTANNRRFAMSTQLAQDEADVQEFEIGSLRDSLEIDDEERNTGLQSGTGTATPNNNTTTVAEPAPPEYSTVSGSNVPPPKDDKSTYEPPSDDHSQEGPSHSVFESETVFALEDEDDGYEQWDDDASVVSDDDDDAGESQGLRKKVHKKKD